MPGGPPFGSLSNSYLLLIALLSSSFGGPERLLWHCCPDKINMDADKTCNEQFLSHTLNNITGPFFEYTISQFGIVGGNFEFNLSGFACSRGSGLVDRLPINDRRSNSAAQHSANELVKHRQT